MTDYIRQLIEITFPSVERIWAGDELNQVPEIFSFPISDEDTGPFNSSSAYFLVLLQE